VTTLSKHNWVKVLTEHFTDADILEGDIGLKVNIRDPINGKQSDILWCNPNLYSNNEEPRPWYDFANVIFNMA
jgi:hypothetical protein